MGRLGVKKKEEMSLRKIIAFAGVFTDSSCDSHGCKQMCSQEESVNTPAKNLQ